MAKLSHKEKLQKLMAANYPASGLTVSRIKAFNLKTKKVEEENLMKAKEFSKLLTRVTRLSLASVFVFSAVSFQGATLAMAETNTIAPAAQGEAIVQPANATLIPYFDTSLTFEERAVDLVSKMTNEEKVVQLNTTAPAIPRLSVPAYNWWQESIRGPRNVRALSFPTGGSLSMSWDDNLMFQQASIIGDECRAYYTYNRRPLSQFNPTINLQRDPRWGRNEEGFGEDPYLVGRLGTEYIRGIQGENDKGAEFMSPSNEKYMKTIATPKHYAANNSEFDRYVGDSQMDERELREYYTYHFRYVELNSNPGSLMTAYNRVNSVPMYAHTYLNNTMLRKMWGFNGYIVSDCDGIANIRNDHYWNPRNSYPELFPTQDTRVTLEQAAAFSLMGGTDMSCTWTSGSTVGGFYGNTSGGNVKTAIEQGVRTDNGIISWDDVDRSLVRMFTQRMATGEFDTSDPATNRNVGGAYGTYTRETHLETAANTATSLEASRKGVVLLRNEGNALPLDLNKNKTIAVVGKMLDRAELGDNNYAANPTTRVTFRQGITKALQDKGFDTANNLKFYTPGTSGSSVSGNLFNIRNLKINDTTVNSTTASTVSGLSKETSNLGYITDGSYAIFDNINYGGEIRNFEFELSTNTATGTWQPVVELRVDSPTGQLISRTQAVRSTGWSNYNWNIGTILNGIVHSENAKLCLVFTTSTSTPPTLVTDELIDEITKADVVIYYGGTGKDPASIDVARENRDRISMDFPANQADEIRKILEKHDNVILPIQAVGMMNITEFTNNPDPAKNVKAVLFTTFNGQFQGQAMAEILVGAVNPTARLSFTWYADESKMPVMPTYNGSNQRNNPVDVDYSIRPKEGSPWGRTYQYYTGPVLYPFGYGLSYSSYNYSNPTISKSTVSNAEKFSVTVDVTNTSLVDGAEVVQVYMTPPGAGTDTGNGIMPFKQLKGYARVDIPAGQTKTVTVNLDTDEWWFIDKEGKRVVNEGVYGVQIGRSSSDIKHTFNVTISGKVAPWLQNVNLESDKIVITKTRQANASLSIALSDETFLNPDLATVVYSSNRPSVATVDQKGVVTGVKWGTAVITATVTYNGKTLSSSFAVLVDEALPTSPEVTSISINGTAIEGFSMDKTTYDCVLAAGSPIPTVTAGYNAAFTTVTIAQATAIPGSATVTASVGDVSVVFTINFTYAPVPKVLPKVYKVTEIPNIDSDKWASAEILDVNKIVQNDVATLAKGKAMVLWDDDNLYVRVDVTDPDLNMANSSAWLKDCVEIYLSEQAIRGSYDSTNGNQYRLDADGAFSRKNNTTQATTITDEAWRRVAKVTSSGYQVYLAIPLTTKPAEGAVFTFDIQLNDATTPANDRTGQVTWSCPNADGYNTAEGWGEIELVGVPKPKGPRSDIFTRGTYEPFWEILRDNTSTRSISANGLSILMEGDDFRNSARNIFLQDGIGDWQVETTIQFNPMINTNFQQAGLIAWQNDQNLVKIVMQQSWGTSTGAVVQISADRDGSFDSGTAQASSNIWSQVNNNGGTIHLRLVRSGDDYTGFYSLNGTTWTQVGTITHALTDVKVGFGAAKTVNASAGVNAVFKNFMVLGDDGPEQPVFTSIVKDGAVVSSYCNKTASAVSGSFYLAVYDQNNKLANVYKKDFSNIASGVVTTADFSVNPATLPAGSTVKAFVWSNDYAPLAQSIDVK